MTWQDCIRLASKYGMKHIEFSVDPLGNGEVYTDEFLNDIKQAMYQNEITCSIHCVSGINLAERVKKIRSASIELLIDSINVAKKIGAKWVTVHLGNIGNLSQNKRLERFYEPSSGEILINKQNIKNYTLTSLRRNFSCYFQNAINYGLTIKDNVTLGDIEKVESPEKISFSLNKSGFDKILENTSHGLNTYVTKMFEDDGIELSIGQNQKLALSRTFYRESSALILDEPSSSLDPEAEDTLFKNLSELCEGKIAIFTSHRLSNVSMASKVIVIEQGKVIEYGTRDELLKMSGRFAELFNYQAEKYNIPHSAQA